MTAPPAASPPDEGDASARPRMTRGDVAHDWWRALADQKRGDPGTLARLRRCRTPGDAATITAAVSLARRLGTLPRDARPTDARVDAALDLARVLAHVREHADERPMRAAGWKRFAGDRKESEAGEDRPRLAEGRFRRLLHTGSGEEQVAAFVRLVALLGAGVNVRALTPDFLDWSHPERGPEVRRRWAFDYYAASSAAPPDRSATDSTPAADEDDPE